MLEKPDITSIGVTDVSLVTPWFKQIPLLQPCEMDTWVGRHGLTIRS